MSSTKKKKQEQLGMNPSTAAHRLRKSIIFDLTKRLDLDFCHRCGDKIHKIENFSIEHKEPWLDSNDPKGLYFNLDNIGFSHLKCNVKSSRYKLDSNTNTGYRGVQLMNDKPRTKKYRALISNNYKSEHIGLFKTAEEAAKAYNKRAKELYGDRAVLNQL